MKTINTSLMSLVAAGVRSPGVYTARELAILKQDEIRWQNAASGSPAEEAARRTFVNHANQFFDN